MEQQLYYSGEFARRAGVSVRTLRFYDHQGLLSPSHHSESGYRLYSDDDLAELQQILALKFLGFTLGEIKRFMKSGPDLLPERLARQKAMMRDRQARSTPSFVPSSAWRNSFGRVDRTGRPSHS